MAEQLQNFLSVGHLHVLDVDKTLIDTRALQRTLEADAELHGLDSDKFRYDRARTSGFDTVSYLKKEMKVSDDQLEDIREMFLAQVRARGAEEYLMPLADDVLQTLEARALPYMLLTTGGGEWQTWKLTATDLIHHPHHITSIRQKAEQFAYGFDPAESRYRFGEVTGLADGYRGFLFENFTIVDDNELAFHNMPRDAAGILIAHDMEQWRRNKQNKPINDLGNVAICYGFTHYHEVISEAA